MREYNHRLLSSNKLVLVPQREQRVASPVPRDVKRRHRYRERGMVEIRSLW